MSSPRSDGERCGEDPVRLPVTDELDLHTFSPREVKDLVPDYLTLCREHGVLTIRIIHGKGTGTLRETVHAVLSRLHWVEAYDLAPPDRGHWGATVVRLCPLHRSPEGDAADRSRPSDSTS